MISNAKYDETIQTSELPFDLARRLRAPVWVYDIDAQRILHANKAACKLWGAPNEAALKDRDLSAGMSTTVAKRLRQYQADFQAKDVDFSEVWTLFPNDIPITVNVVYTAFPMADGRMSMMCEVLGETAQTTETLRSTKALLHTDVNIALFTIDGLPLYTNPAARRVFSGVKMTLPALFGDQKDFFKVQIECKKHGESRIITRLRTGENLRWFDLSVKQCLDASTGEQALLITASDVNELKSIKAKSAIDQEQLEATFATSLDGIIIISCDGTILEFNESAQRIFGHKRDDILKNNIADVIIPEPRRDKFHLNLLNMRNKGRPYTRAERKEIIARRSNGEEFTAEIAISQSRSSNGEIFIVYIRDISLAKAAENAVIEAKEAAELANKAKSEFLANMSHEIRTPMNGVLGMLDVLSRTELDEKQRHCTDIIQKSGNNLLGIISDILDFSKLEAGKTSIHPVPGNLKTVVTDCVNLFRPRALEKNLTLDVNYSRETAELFIADYNRIQQILANLISNAVKFTHEGGINVKVFGETSHDQANIKIVIEDTGIGIADDKIHLVFDKFTQAESSTTRKYGGTGLGLAISRGLTEAMNGQLSVKSNIGTGTTFTLELPLKVSKNTPEKTSKPEDKNLSTLQKKLDFLIVEDEDINRVVISNLLKHPKVNITFAENGKEAIEIFKLKKFDLIFMDVSMPVMDGITATKLIRKLELEALLKPTPIICLTAHAMQSDKERFIECGMDDYLSKPLQKTKLVEVTSKWIKLSRKTAQTNQNFRQRSTVA